MFIKDDYVIMEMAKKLNIDPKAVNLNYYEKAYNYGFYVNKLMGLSPYGLFLYEFHFKDYDHLVAITYTTMNGREMWLPLYRESGMINFYNVDRFWGRWNFKSNNTKINQIKLSAAIRMYTIFWAAKNGIPLTNAKFNVKVKVYDKITGWEKDYLNKQIAKEWKDGGYVEFLNYKFFDDNLKNIEAIK